jgi:hypothetical protein
LHAHAFEHTGSWMAADAGTVFPEFTEGRDDATHRVRGPADSEEAALEARLAQVAAYNETRDAQWDEVPLPPR